VSFIQIKEKNDKEKKKKEKELLSQAETMLCIIYDEPT
jgi:hypothetical protein